MFVALLISILIALHFSVLLYNLKNVNISSLKNKSKEDKKVLVFIKQFESWISLRNSLRIWLLFSLVTYGFLVGTYCHIYSNLKTVAIIFVSSVFLLVILNAISLKIFHFSIDVFHFMIPLYIYAYYIVFPFNYLYSFIAGLKDQREEKITEEDLIKIVDKASKDGVLEKKEKEMINNVVLLADTTASEIMIPRLDVVAIEKKESLTTALSLAMDKGLSRLPVYDETIDNVIGIIHTKDLMKPLSENTLERPLMDFARPPMLIPENKKIDEILVDMQRKKIAMAIVVDEYGGTEGILTLEDVLEEIVGEINDEYDDVVSEPVKKVSEKSYIVAGTATIYEVNEALSINLPEDEDFDTISGYVYDKLGHIPVKDEFIESDGLKITVKKVVRHRITLLFVEII